LPEPHFFRPQIQSFDLQVHLPSQKKADDLTGQVFVEHSYCLDMQVHFLFLKTPRLPDGHFLMLHMPFVE